MEKLIVYQIVQGSGMDCMGRKRKPATFTDELQALKYMIDHSEDWCSPTLYKETYEIAETYQEANELDGDSVTSEMIDMSEVMELLRKNHGIDVNAQFMWEIRNYPISRFNGMKCRLINGSSMRRKLVDVRLEEKVPKAGGHEEDTMRLKPEYLKRIKL